MIDLIFSGLAAGFFAATLGLMRLCDRLAAPDRDGTPSRRNTP